MLVKKGNLANLIELPLVCSPSYIDGAVRAVPRWLVDPLHLAEREARRLVVHVRHGVAADECPVLLTALSLYINE
jgi:hypothetical protein